MSKGAGIGIGIGVVVLILVAWVGMTVSAMASESNAAKTYLESALANKTPQAEVSQKLQAMGFTMNDSPGTSTGAGPNHSLLVYSSHIVANLKFDQDGKTLSYHLDKS